MSERDALLAGIVADPLEETRWLVLADWLEEHDDPRRAELLRLHRRMIATCCEPDAHPERAAWQARMTELLVAGVRPCVPQETLALPGGVPMTFSFIPPGAFLMGSDHPDGNGEKPVHRVEVALGFFLGVYPVTQAQWKAVMSTEPSKFKGQQRPVETVSWDDCREFCMKLAELTGRRVVLPREAEWEFACRAGTTAEYHFGDVINTDLVNYSNGNLFGKREYGETTDVGSFPANSWGLYDMHGNVCEWCEDVFGPYPLRGKVENKEDYDGSLRVLRGGSWPYLHWGCRAATRYRGPPAYRRSFYGFRACLRLD